MGVGQVEVGAKDLLGIPDAKVSLEQDDVTSSGEFESMVNEYEKTQSSQMDSQAQTKNNESEQKNDDDSTSQVKSGDKSESSKENKEAKESDETEEERPVEAKEEGDTELSEEEKAILAQENMAGILALDLSNEEAQNLDGEELKVVNTVVDELSQKEDSNQSRRERNAVQITESESLTDELAGESQSEGQEENIDLRRERAAQFAQELEGQEEEIAKADLDEGPSLELDRRDLNSEETIDLSQKVEAGLQNASKQAVDLSLIDRASRKRQVKNNDLQSRVDLEVNLNRLELNKNQAVPAKIQEQAQRMRSVPNQITDALKTLVKEIPNGMQLSLDPPEWGHVSMRVESKNGQLQVSIVAEQQFVKEALERSTSALRQALAEMGMSLGDLHVGVGQGSQEQNGEEEDVKYFDDAENGSTKLDEKKTVRRSQVSESSLIDEHV